MLKLINMRFTQINFYNKLESETVSLTIVLNTGAMIPDRIEVGHFFATFKGDICDEDNKFLFQFEAKAKVEFKDINTINDLKKAIDGYLPELLPKLQEKIKIITQEMGMRPLDINFGINES